MKIKKMKRLNNKLKFYIDKITTYQQDLSFYLQTLKTPLKDLEKLDLPIKKADLSEETLKKDIILFFAKSLIFEANFTLMNLAMKFKAKFYDSYQTILNIPEDKVNNKFMEFTLSIFSRFDLKKKNQLPDLLNGEIYYWIIKDQLLKLFKEKSKMFVRHFVLLRKSYTKLVKKLIDLIVKKQKFLSGKFKPDIGKTLYKKLSDFESAKLRYETDKKKIEAKLELFLNPPPPPVVVKKVKEDLKNNVFSPATWTSSSKSKKKNKSKKYNNLFGFFNKKKTLTMENYQNYKPYNRWKSLGSFSFSNMKLTSLNFEDFKNNTKIKDTEKLDYRSNLNQIKQKEKENQKTKSNFKFVRFEDFLKEFKEYKGIFTHNIINDLLKDPLHQHGIFDYNLFTEDEIQLLDADSIKSDEMSIEEEKVNELNDFLVSDHYQSENEENEDFDNYRSSQIGTKPKIYEFNREGDELNLDLIQLQKNLSCIKLSSDPYPLPICSEDKEDVLDDMTLSTIIIQLIGLPTKKAIYDKLEEMKVKFSKKVIYNKIKEKGKIVYYVNPVNYNNIIVNKDYFELLDENLEGIEQPGKRSPMFLENLILKIHGLINNTSLKEEKVYKKMKELYEMASKSHIDKNIRKIARTGFMFDSGYLKQMKISKIKTLSILKNRFMSNLY